ncbi:Uncharacterized protein BM_BM7144 [Brugia malayi]|uniref:Bm7144 n=2 Tax=Brugia TaxID=6278 RepID=A0A0K0JR34_BRUMA|nr:Uncharacterized protein BM_BM7144 [Brugia malayi]CRZ21736.1 Bm7144 [Brugia malayi]VDO26447.1 unnamed protein product [Brugia timori]VIO99586.1 Uncharacterized protein BM_BM7144 [Brugia malayi]
MMAQLLFHSICPFLIASYGCFVIVMSDVLGKDQDAKKTETGKEGSGRNATSAGVSVLGTTNQAENDNSGVLSSTVKNQNLSTNAMPISKRVVPRKDYKLIQKVEEKVVQEKSIRTGSPRRRRATLLHFVPINDLPDVARVQLLLSNISERPLQFKLKSEPGPDISALPSARGHINAHGSAKCILTWRREANVEKWSDAQQPKMLLVLDFLRDKTKNEKHTLTRLIGKVVSGQTCDSDRPPIEQLMLDATTNESSRSMSKDSLLLDQAHIPRNEIEEKDKAKSEGIVNSIADWFNQQSKDSLLGLLFLMIFFFFLGTISNSKQKQHD